MKKSLSLSIAAAALVTSVMTGCSSDSDTTVTPDPTAAVEIQGSIVYKIIETGLTLSFDNNNTCFNNTVLQTATKAFTLNSSEFNASTTSACAESFSQNFGIALNPTKAYAIEALGDENNASKVIKFSLKVGTGEYKGEKGKKVNAFSTLALNQGNPVEDIDVNADPRAKAIKDLIQAKLAAGALISSFANDINVTALATTDGNITSLAIPNFFTLFGISESAADELQDAYETDVEQRFEDASSGNNELENLSKDAAVQTLTAESISLATKTVTLDNDNKFAVSIASGLTLDTIGDITFNTTALSEPALFSKVHNITFTTEISNGDKMMKLLVTGGYIKTIVGSTDVEVILPSTTQLVLTQENINGLSGIIGTEATATLNSELSNTDYTFNLNTILNTLDYTQTESFKNALNDFLSLDAVYKVSLKSETETLNITFEDVEGTVTVGTPSETTPVEDTTPAEDTNTTTPAEDTNTTTPAEDTNTTTPAEDTTPTTQALLDAATAGDSCTTSTGATGSVTEAVSDPFGNIATAAACNSAI